MEFATFCIFLQDNYACWWLPSCFAPIFYPVKIWMLTSEVMLMYPLWKLLLLCCVAVKRVTWWRAEEIFRLGEAADECHFSCSSNTADYLDRDWFVVKSYVSLGLMYTRLERFECNPNLDLFIYYKLAMHHYLHCVNWKSLSCTTKQPSLLTSA